MKRVCLKQFPGPCMPHPRTNASNGTGRRRRRLAVTDQCFNASIAQLGATPQRRYAYDHVNEASLYVESNYSERAWDYQNLIQGGGGVSLLLMIFKYTK